MTTILLAMDRASVRRRDANGYLHVEISNLSKANICPYMGSEIPNWRDLGLEPDRVYRSTATPRNWRAAPIPSITSRFCPSTCRSTPTSGTTKSRTR